MFLKSRPFAAAALLALSLSACDANISVNVPNPQPSASAQPSATPQSPAPATSPSPAASQAPPTAAPSTAAPSTAPVASAPPTSGQLTIVGADLFDKYPLTFRQGQRWEYSMKMPSVAVSVPQFPGGLPGGIQIPGIGGDSEFGTLIMEVIRVDGSNVTMRTQVNTTLQGAAPPMDPKEVTFAQRSTASLYTEAFANGQGTMTWRADGSESLTVAAGSYSADRIKGRLDADLASGGASATATQDITLWMAPNVGMVKQQTITTSSGSTTSGSAEVILELKSFSG